MGHNPNTYTSHHSCWLSCLEHNHHHLGFKMEIFILSSIVGIFRVSSVGIYYLFYPFLATIGSRLLCVFVLHGFNP